MPAYERTLLSVVRSLDHLFQSMTTCLVAPFIDSDRLPKHRRFALAHSICCCAGGFNWVAADALGPGEYSLFGTQLIPWCCGTKEYGRTGWVIGAKRLLRIATEGGARIIRTYSKFCLLLPVIPDRNG